MEGRPMSLDAAASPALDGRHPATRVEHAPGGDASGVPDGTLDEIHGCDGMVLLRGITFGQGSAPRWSGVAHIAYMPDRRVVGLSTLVRLVHVNARRFHMQERLTVRIAGGVEAALRPRGVAVVVEVVHQAAVVTTARMLGVFRSDPDLRREFRALLAQR